jgi:molecular chaperone HtpG
VTIFALAAGPAAAFFLVLFEVMPMAEVQNHAFQAEVGAVLRLVVNSLYSHKEVFIRELVSNASDALDRLRFESLTESELLPAGEELKIRITYDKTARTLTIEDNGIGMTADELAQNLGTIARSGTREFLKKIEQAREAQSSGVQLIGQFGVGFYSGYLVADKVIVTSKKAGTTLAHRWTSDGKEGFSIESAERAQQGTTIVLHLKEDQSEFLEEYRLKSLIQRYSDYIDHPIELLRTPRPKTEEKSEEKPEEAAPEEPKYERVNRANALWQRNPKEVTAEQYDEFYKHLTHDWQEPLAHKHFRVEGTQMFTGLLFLPKHPPFDLFDPSSKHGVRLHVQRVLIMENSEELLPKWLRFLRGVVDSEDLPLNVSRETLQDSRAVRTIRKQVTNHALTMLEDLQKDKPEDYAAFWESFGAVLKEGLHFDPEDKARISKLLRFASSTEAGAISLESYVSRMKEGQKAIYYAVGPSLNVLSASPHLETLRARGYEVLLLTDPVDPFVMSNLPEFDGKPLKDAMSADLDLSQEGDKKSESDDEKEALFDKIKTVLGDKIKEVRASKRLADSPVCLVLPEGAMAPHIERMLRERQMGVPETKRVLEVNRDHPVIVSLRKLLLVEPDSSKLTDWVEMLYDQALIAEGSPPEDPARFAKRMSQLLTLASDAAIK